MRERKRVTWTPWRRVDSLSLNDVNAEWRAKNCQLNVFQTWGRIITCLFAADVWRDVSGSLIKHNAKVVCVSDTLFPCSIELCVFVCLSHSGGPKELVCVHCLDTRKTNPCAFHLFSSFKNALWQLPDCIEIYFFLVCNAIFSGFYRIAGRLSEMDGWCD